MVLLENLDFNNLSLDKFRSHKCLCELCDDGCFDRLKQVHHPECKKKLIKSKLEIRPATEHGVKKCPLSHYKETFVGNWNGRPASAFRPPIDEFTYLPRGPIDLNTIQKTEYKPHEATERTKPFKIADNYEKSKEPFSGVTSYKAEYILKENNGLNNIVKRNSNESTMKISIEKLPSNTTTKEHFKDWNALPPSRAYNERPSYAGESLFPSKERNFVTSTNSVHQAIPVSKKTKLNTGIEMKGSIKLEGEMDLKTNYRDTYVRYKDTERTKSINPNQNNVFSDKKPLLTSITQTRSDFVQYPNHIPPKPADVNPYNSNLDQYIYPTNKRDHATNYSTEFVGHDVRENPAAKSYKKDNGPYQKPAEKIDTETVTMRDFKPIDISKIPRLKAQKIVGKLNIPGGPMETKTMSMMQFQPYEVKPIVLARDPQPYYYIPPKLKFQTETTTKETFKGQQGVKTISFKPDFNNIDNSGKIDMNTNYRNAFINHGLTMCEAKAFLVAKSRAGKTSDNGESTNLPKTPLKSSI